MTDDVVTLEEVEAELRAIAAKRGPLAKSLASLDRERDQCLAAKAFILAKRNERSKRRSAMDGKKSTDTDAGTRGRYFRSEGDTVNQVRMLYGRPDGITNVEAARILNMKPKNSRRNFERLIQQGLAVRMGDVYALNAQGRKEWENSPLFRKRAANG
jgi:hypothetical protein